MAKYVGKRIVPRLCGAWNDHTKYEMLSVVRMRTQATAMWQEKKYLRAPD